MARATQAGEFEDSPMEHGYGANRHPLEARASEIVRVKSQQVEQSKMKTEPDWIEHDGSAVCPVPAGHDVEVRWRTGGKGRNTCPEGRMWEFQGLDYVTHYRDWTAWEQSKMTKADDVAGERAKIVAWLRADTRGRGMVGYRECWNIAAMIERGAHEPAPVDPLAAIVQKVACRLRQHGLYRDSQMADELEREVARARSVTLETGRGEGQ